MALAEPGRLRGLPGPAVPAATVAAHRARRVGSSVLVTGDSGRYVFLEPSGYERYLAGLPEGDPLAPRLAQAQLLRDRLDFPGLASSTAQRRLMRWPGPNVHTLVVTLRCNFKCLYCHASVVGQDRVDMDMTVETARRAVDLIFQSPSPSLMIEFQGGEPLLNWPVVKFVLDYALLKNRSRRKELHFGLISNFSLLDDEKLDFLIEKGVSFCTSLDGPEDLHNRNRLFLGGSGHAQAVAGLRKVLARRAAGAAVDVPNAICTVTRFSLGRHREIVDQLVELGLERVQLGPLDPIGFAARSWDAIGYGSAEFLGFYERALDYIIDLSARGTRIYEKTAMILLVRILEGGHWRFPNADGLARLAYNHDGGVYTSEEGRLLANEGDDFFRIGSVGDAYQTLLEHPTVRASMLAAAPESQPMCFQCAYSPYCTVLPVYNYRAQGGLSGRMPENGWCEKMMGLFDLIFARLNEPRARAVLESWLRYKEN